MKILNTMAAGVLTLLFLSAGYSFQEGEKNYILDSGKSKIIWKAKKGANVFSGQLKIREGFLLMNQDQIEQAVIYANTQSIDCRSCGDREKAEDILTYVQSEEFLNIKKIDFAVFKLFRAEKSTGAQSGNYTVEGSLTIIGYTNNISLPVNVSVKKDRVFINGSVSLNRDLWNLKNPVEGKAQDYMDQTIELIINLEGQLKN